MGVSEPRLCVLVVDDDVDHGCMLEALLESDGFSVLLATSHAEARHILETRRVDVLVSDLSLGDGTALDLVTQLGANRPRVAIVLSGFDSADDVERTLQAGFYAHLAKPTPLEVLREVIAAGLRQAPSGVHLARGGSPPRAGSKRSGT
jgi:DNA-binding response OmpR family regulator